MNTQLILIAAAIAAVTLIFAVLTSRGYGNRYEPCPIMTSNELEFFRRLEQAHPNGYVFPQVSMAAVMRPISGNSKTRLAAFRAISQKRIDFAIYSRSMDLLCVVELDDRTHNARNDAIRDQMLATAGIKTIRWNSRKKPEVNEIGRMLDECSQELVAAFSPATHEDRPSMKPFRTVNAQSIIERNKAQAHANEQAGKTSPPKNTAERGARAEARLQTAQAQRWLRGRAKEQKMDR